MRTGVNPEKGKKEFNREKSHRVIIPVFIPNSKDDYYKDALKVLKECIFSIINTVNPETTVISVINNNSNKEVSDFLNTQLIEKYLDKVVSYRENRGKVYAVLSEAKASFEDFITICDADVFFFPGWEQAVFNIFKSFPNAGVVSPVPSQNLALYHNATVFYDKYWSIMKYEKVVSDKDCELFLNGLGNSALLRRNKHPYDWKQKQYYLNGRIKALVGANHYVATYRKNILEFNTDFPQLKFKKGYEEEYLDLPCDKLGYYRLSTIKAYAYHMGNKYEQINRTSENSETKADISIFSSLVDIRKSKTPYFIRKSFFRVLKKFKNL